jgi:hypothetical protein
MDGGEGSALQQRVGHLRGQETRTRAHLQQKGLLRLTAVQRLTWGFLCKFFNTASYAATVSEDSGFGIGSQTL